MLDGTRKPLVLGRPLLLSEEGFNDEVDDIAKRHVTQEAPQQAKRLHRIVR